jgi:translation elongation factor EF-1beta
MGRGRSKAKQTRVARDLKYHSQDIDVEKLAKELQEIIFHGVNWSS